MNDHTLFLGKFLQQGTAIASVAPSSRWLSRLTVQNIDWQRTDALVELGAGTGPITRVIAAHVRPECRVVVVERDPDFARLLRERFQDLPNFDIVRGDVRDLGSILGDRGLASVDHVVSGLPVPSFRKEAADGPLPGGGRSPAPDGDVQSDHRDTLALLAVLSQVLRRRPVRVRAAQPASRGGLFLPRRHGSIALKRDDRPHCSQRRRWT